MLYYGMHVVNVNCDGNDKGKYYIAKAQLCLVSDRSSLSFGGDELLHVPLPGGDVTSLHEPGICRCYLLSSLQAGSC